MPGSSTHDRDLGQKADRSIIGVAQEGETRGERRRRRNRQALIEAGYQVMAQKGIDAATMSEITELADVGAGTVYNYFASKDELAMCIMEQVMDRLSQRIEAVTNNFTDPAQVYAFGIRNVMIAAPLTKDGGGCCAARRLLQARCIESWDLTRSEIFATP